MIRASIDIGSNSVLLLAAEIDISKNKIIKELLNLSHITSLGRDIDQTKMFHPDSMNDTFLALVDYKNQLKAINISPDQVIVTATEASRVATNASLFFEKIKKDLGFKTLVITSEAEAYLTAKGVAHDIDSDQSMVIMDIGGASTELIRVQVNPFKMMSSVSLPIGSVRAYNWMSENNFEKKIQEIFSADFSFYQTKTLLCVAGGMTSIAAMYLGLKKFEAQKVDGFSLSFDSYKEFAEKNQKMQTEDFLQQFPFLEKRAKFMPAILKIALKFGECLKIENIKISTRGLRYGTILEGVLDDQFTIGKSH